MTQTALRNKHYLIIGLGLTGLSCARFCQQQQLKFSLCDTRSELKNLSEIEHEFPGVDIQLGELAPSYLAEFDELLVSPGIDTNGALFVAAKEAGVAISGDIQLFHTLADKPIVAITGSNGKSTVTTLVNNLLNAAGIKAVAGGNLGVPALDLLSSDADVYVLELSSFQLETTRDLGADVATILNISPDHMDRYGSMAAYERAKQRIFQGAKKVVVNLDDDHSLSVLGSPSDTSGFGLTLPQDNNFGLIQQDGQIWLAKAGQPLLPTSKLKIRGAHNAANALAALAIVDALGVNLEACLDALAEFSGLPHRCQWVTSLQGVEFFNDSKGTNVGSTLAAIKGFLPEVEGKIWLLLGGESKGQSFTELAQVLAHNTKIIPVTFGADAKRIAASMGDVVSQEVAIVSTLQQALDSAYAAATSGDIVLLSPACASFDQFANYEQRGQAFCEYVEALS